MSTEPTPNRLLPIDDLNQLPRERFALALKPLFEAAEPLAAALYARRPFSSYEHLLEQAAALLARLPEAERIQVVNAHPRIGVPPDLLRQESLVSFREQGHDRQPPDAAAEAEVYRQLAELNAAYEARHGFRFVVFVNRRPRAAIVPILRQRLGNPTDQELETALGEMLAIACDRLRSLSA